MGPHVDDTHLSTRSTDVHCARGTSEVLNKQPQYSPQHNSSRPRIAARPPGVSESKGRAQLSSQPGALVGARQRPAPSGVSSKPPLKHRPSNGRAQPYAERPAISLDSLKTSSFYPGPSYHSSPKREVRKQAQSTAVLINKRPLVEPLHLPTYIFTETSRLPTSTVPPGNLTSSFPEPAWQDTSWENSASRSQAEITRPQATAFLPGSQYERVQTPNQSYLSQSSWLETSRVSAYPTTANSAYPSYQASGTFSSLNGPNPGGTRAYHPSGMPADGGLESETSRGRIWFSNAGQGVHERGALQRRAHGSYKDASAGAPASKSSLEARLQSAAHTYWAQSYCDPPSTSSPVQAVHEATSTFQSTALSLGGSSRPVIAVDAIEAEAALELALAQKRRQLHGMLGSPVGGEGGPWAPRRALEVFTKRPPEGGADSQRNGTGVAEEGSAVPQGGAVMESMLQEDGSSSSVVLAVKPPESSSKENSRSGQTARGEEVAPGSADVSNSRADLRDGPVSGGFDGEGHRVSEVDPSSIERRLSRIGEMLDISSLPISSRAAAQRQTQWSSLADSWRHTGVPSKAVKAVSGLSGGRQDQVEQSSGNESSGQDRASGIFDPEIEESERGGREGFVVEGSNAATGAAEKVGTGADVKDEAPVLGGRASHRSSVDEEFFSVPPTPLWTGPAELVSGRSTTGRAEHGVGKGESNQVEPGREQQESGYRASAHPIPSTAQPGTERTGSFFGSQNGSLAIIEVGEQDRGILSGNVGRVDGFRTLADGASLWAPNPRPRRRSESALMPPQSMWSANPTGPQFRGESPPAQSQGLELGNQRGRLGPGLITELEGEETDDLVEDVTREGGSASAKKVDGRLPRGERSPPFRRVVKTPKGSKGKNRPKPIQLMSVLKSVTAGRGKVRDSAVAFREEEPATPEFATDGGGGRPNKSAVRNLQRSFDSVAREGSVDDLVSVELNEEPGQGSPGTFSGLESQVATTGAEWGENSSPRGASLAGSQSLGGFVELGEKGRGQSPEARTGPPERPPATPLKGSRGSINVRDSIGSSFGGASGDDRESRDAVRQLAAEKEARRATESRAQAAEENVKVLTSSLASARAEQAAIEHQLEEEYNRKATQQSALKSWADVERVQKERQVRQLTSERDELRSQVAAMEALAAEGQQFAAEVHRRRAQVQEREDEIQGLKQKARQLENGLQEAWEESGKLRAAMAQMEEENGELVEANEQLRLEVLSSKVEKKEHEEASTPVQGRTKSGDPASDEALTHDRQWDERAVPASTGKPADGDAAVWVAGEVSGDLVASLQQQAAELVSLRAVLNAAVAEMLAVRVNDDSGVRSEEGGLGRFVGFGKMWGGKGKSEADGLKERIAKLEQVLSSTLEKLGGGASKEERSQERGVQRGGEEGSKDSATQIHEPAEKESLERVLESGSAGGSDVGCQTEASTAVGGELMGHLQGREKEAKEQVTLLTWQKEKLAALEKQLREQAEHAAALGKEKLEAEGRVSEMEVVIAQLGARLEESKTDLEKASAEREMLHEAVRRSAGSQPLVLGDTPSRGGDEQIGGAARPPPLGLISPALSQLSLVGITPTKALWELDESDNSFLNQYANPIFEREAEMREVEEARAQVDELVKEKVRLETDLQAAHRATAECQERLAGALRKVEMLGKEKEQLERGGESPRGSVATDRAVAGSEFEDSSAVKTLEEKEALVEVKARVLELEAQNTALKLKLAEVKRAESAQLEEGAAIAREAGWASKSRRLEEELQAVVAKWEAEAQRLGQLEAEGQERERRFREEEARVYAMERELEHARAQTQKAKAAAADARQAAAAARRRLEDKESEASALAEAAGDLRRICTEQEDVIEALKREHHDVLGALKEEHNDAMAGLKRQQEEEVEAERREKDRLAHEVGRLLGNLKNGSSGPGLKKDDLLNLGELRRQLAAAEQRVAELEALLEESKKKDGLLGLVQKAHQTIRKDMGDADRAMNEMRTRYKEMEARLAANLKEARDKEAEARTEADKLLRDSQKLRADVSTLETALEHKETALKDAQLRTESLEKRAEVAEREADGLGTGTSSADVQKMVALAEARAAREQVEMHERAAREATRRVEAAERKADESAKALADLERALTESLEGASQARGRADALQATLAERERALKALRDELQGVKDTWQARDQSDASAQREVAELKRSVGDYKAQVKELVAINEELLAFGQSKEREVEHLHKRIKHLETQGQGAHERFEGLEAQTEQLQAEARAQKIRYEALEDKLAASEKEVRRQEARVDGVDAAHRERVQEVLRELERVKEEKSGLRAMLQSQSADLEQARAALRAMEGLEASAITQLADLKERLAERDRRVSELLEKVKVLKEEVRTMVDELDTCRKQVDSAREEARRQEKEKVVLRNRAAQLEEDVMEREGQISILRGSLNHDGDFILDSPKEW